MGRERYPINPGHGRVRTALRVVGPLLLLAGLACIAVAFVDFFRGFGEMDRAPGLFWLFFLGLPLLFVGFMLTNAGFIGAVARYAAQEQAPVAADLVNELAESTAPGVRTVAGAVAQGLAGESCKCGACGEANDGAARFCDSCGAALGRECPACATANDGDARFCDSCGASLGD